MPRLTHLKVRRAEGRTDHAHDQTVRVWTGRARRQRPHLAERLELTVVPETWGRGLEARTRQARQKRDPQRVERRGVEALTRVERVERRVKRAVVEGVAGPQATEHSQDAGVGYAAHCRGEAARVGLEPGERGVVRGRGGRCEARCLIQPHARGATRAQREGKAEGLPPLLHGAPPATTATTASPSCTSTRLKKLRNAG